MSSTAPALNVLISGSGIAGPCFAFWLHRLVPNARITIIERAPAPRLGGQAIDLRSASVPIVERMGLLPKVREKTTTEVGMEFVYLDGKRKATFSASGNVEQQSMTSEFEILRGDMARILYDATRDLPNIIYIFDEMITSIEELDNDRVEVTFKNKELKSEFDLVVGADGMMSRTRRLVFGHGPQNDDYLHRLGQYSALFTMPKTDDDTNFAQWYNATRGRLFLLRPDQYGTTRAYLSVTDPDLSRFNEIDALMKGDMRMQQQEWFAREFEGAGFQTERCLREMTKADDYYMQQIAQVKMDTWVKGHVALVGDAGYCPSPISGMGTGAAIVGAYVLAGEISKSPHDIHTALARYDEVTRPFVERVQKLFPGTPQMANPQTEWGVKVFNLITGIISHPLARKFGWIIGSWLPAMGPTNIWAAPEYEDTKA